VFLWLRFIREGYCIFVVYAFKDWVRGIFGWGICWCCFCVVAGVI